MSVYDRRNVYKLDLNTQPMGNKFRKSKDAIPLTTDKYPEKMGGKVMPKMDPKLPTLVVCKKDLDRNLEILQLLCNEFICSFNLCKLSLNATSISPFFFLPHDPQKEASARKSAVRMAQT